MAASSDTEVLNVDVASKYGKRATLGVSDDHAPSGEDTTEQSNAAVVEDFVSA